MEKSRFSEEKMVKILREADETLVVQVAKSQGVSEQTLYAWRKRFGELEAMDVRKRRELEQEHTKLCFVARARCSRLPGRRWATSRA